VEGIIVENQVIFLGALPKGKFIIRSLMFIVNNQNQKKEYRNPSFNNLAILANKR